MSKKQWYEIHVSRDKKSPPELVAKIKSPGLTNIIAQVLKSYYKQVIVT